MIRTFKEIRAVAQQWRRELNAAKMKSDCQIEESSKLYGGNLLKQKVSEAKRDYEKVVERKKELQVQIENLRYDKLSRLRENVAKAPTLEQSAKLDDIRSRREIDIDELTVVAESMSDNYGALRTLREIASKHGYSLIVPDYKDIEQKINNAADYAIRMLDTSEDTYHGLAFYGNYENTPFDYMIDGLDDENSFSFVPEVKPRVITETEQEILDRVFRGTLPFDLPNRVREAAKSPEMRRLIELSDIYSRFLYEKEDE